MSKRKTGKPLHPRYLYHRCDPAQFKFKSTAELADFGEIIGQERAVEAVQFGIGIRREGYNLFALGPSGTGKHTVVREFLEKQAASEPTPSDWCYVNNFDLPHKPRALRLPPGRGVVLRRDMEQLIEDLMTVIPAAFESEDYRTRKQVIEEEFKERHERAFAEVRQHAEERGIALLRTPEGFAFAPLRNGKVVGPKEFERLPEEEQRRIEQDVAALEQELQAVVQQSPHWEKEGREKVKALNREVTTHVVGRLTDSLRRQYGDMPEVVRYLDDVQQDVIVNVHDFLHPQETPASALLGVPPSRTLTASPAFRRYQVNVLVDRDAMQGAPVIFEDHPTYQNLVGRVEYIAHMGALVTDFNLIKPGALHRASGGYLMIEAYKLLTQPFAWEGLKRALRSSRITIESVGQMLSLVSTVSLEPEPIPLDVKVVLLGDRFLYYLLAYYDPEFSELFKVAADFNEEMDRSPENNLRYARLVGSLARKEGLRPFDRGAVARVVEHSSRLVEDAEKLSTRMGAIVDLLREADYWAGQAARQVVGEKDVQRAIDAKIHRADRLREKVFEAMRRGTILIETKGEKVGQVNGLSVIQLGDFTFGRPSRITARVWLGKGEVVDIEREVELGGPIHSKGVLILSGFLGARYATTRPLSLSASLVFEQSYGMVEGDSASSAELYALLSALGEVPIRQSIAVTGSVNQHGQVQAIGGVNEKIEGYFDVCRMSGLAGDQGVLIPASNVKHLMLRQDVVEAAAAGKFHIYAVETVDEGIEILTGVRAGKRGRDGKFPAGSVNQRVEARLAALAEKKQVERRQILLAFGGGSEEEEQS
jgi:lon-related putative ATP-dependent protease